MRHGRWRNDKKGELGVSLLYSLFFFWLLLWGSILLWTVRPYSAFLHTASAAAVRLGVDVLSGCVVAFRGTLARGLLRVCASSTLSRPRIVKRRRSVSRGTPQKEGLVKEQVPLLLLSVQRDSG